MNRRRWLLYSFLFFGVIRPGLAQTAAIPFTLRVQQGASSGTVSNGGTVGIATDGIGRAATVTVSFTYRGASTASITAVDLAGSTQFTVTRKPQVPAALSPNGEVNFDVTFTPTASASATAQLAISWTEGTTLAGVFLVNFTGAAPEFAVAYLLQNDQNAISIADGGTIQFPSTPANSITTATVILLNRGSAPLDLQSLTFTSAGQEFQVLGLPLLPGSLAAGGSVRFTIRYAPRQSGSHTASFQIKLLNQTFTATIRGTSTGPAFSYELLTDSLTSPLLPNVAVNLPDTDLGVTRNFVVRVRNDGDGDGVVAGISILGPGYALADLPFLPLTLTPGSSAFFSLNLSPTLPGRAIGRMRVGNDTFEFLANGLGARLTFSYGTGLAAVAIPAGGVIAFNPTPVGERSSLDFTIANTGTMEAVFASISTASNGEFSLSAVPASPITLVPDGKLVLRITFSPIVTGSITSTLRIDTLGFTLTGIARAPAALQGYRFSGSTGQQDPLQQIPVGITLNAPYPADVTGVLTLSFTSDSFAVDPSAQFVTGGRAVSFTIPANTTAAIFQNNAQQIRLQTGSVAGTIVLTPSFSLSNGVSITPNSPLSLSLTVPSKAPVVVAFEAVTTVSPSAFNLLVTGYATARSLTRMELQFTAKPGSTLSNAQFTLDLSSLAGTWYRGGASQNFGSLFTAAIPITLQGLPTPGTNSAPRPISDFLESVSVVLVGDQGRSNSMNVTLP